MTGQPRVVGLDLSLTATGVAYSDGSAATFRTQARGCARLAWVREEVTSAVGCDVVGCHDHPALVVMEGYSYASANQAHQVGELGGVIRLALHEAGVPFVVVAPAALKKYATGKGNANKAAMLQAAWQRLGYEGTDDNEADALWLRAMGLDALGFPVCSMPVENRKALLKVEWPTVAPSPVSGGVGVPGQETP